MGTVSKPHDFTTGVIDPDEVNDDFDTLYTLVNGNLSTVNIEDGTLINDDMSTEVKPVTRFDENFQSHVYSGMALSTDGATATVATGTAYVDGVRVVTGALSSNACDTTAAGTLTTYVDLSKTGAFSWNKNETASSGYMRLYSVSCDSTEITGTTAIRPLTAVGTDEIEVDACTKVYSAKNTTTNVSTTSTTHATLLDAGTVDVLSGDELVIRGIVRLSVSGNIVCYTQMNVGGVAQDVESEETIETSGLYRMLPCDCVYSVSTDSTALPVIMTYKVSATTATCTAGDRMVTITRHRR